MRGSADRVEDGEVCVAAVAADDGSADTALDLLGLGLQHGRLVRDADAGEVEVRIETLGHRLAPETFAEGSGIASLFEVFADVVDVGKGENDEAMAFPIFTRGARRGGAGFLVVGFAVDDGGDPFLGKPPHAFPDFHHITAGGVDDVAAARFDLVHEGDRSSESGHDDDIVFGQFVVLAVHRLPRERNDLHLLELTVHLRIVDDLADEEDAVVGEDPARGVGEVDGALDAVAKAELLREADRRVADGENPSPGADLLDDRTLVVVRYLSLNALHHLGGADIDASAAAFGGSGHVEWRSARSRRVRKGSHWSGRAARR